MRQSRQSGSRRLLIIAILMVLAGQLAFVAAQLVSIGLSRHLWVADLANFIRLHLMIAGFGLAAIGLILPSRATRVGALAVLVAAVSPYFFLTPQAPSLGGQEFTLVTANVMVDNPDPSGFLQIADVVSADVLVLQEMTPRWQDALIATGLWPYESTRNMRANTDMKVFSRFPITSEAPVSPGSRDTGERHASRLELRVHGRPVILYAVHAQTPRSPEMWRERAAYFRDLQVSIMGEPAHAAVIVAGDWNTPSWSPVYRDFLEATGYNATDPRWWPFATRFAVRFGSILWLGVPIDRVVLSPDVGLESIGTGPKFGSNHVPVITRLSIP